MNVTSGNHFDYVYNYTDHLGNIRLSYSRPQIGVTTILEENHYYPFGMKHINYGMTKNKYVLNPDKTPMYAVLEPVERSNYQYKYNGKEYQDEFSLNWYDYEARNYDPAIGRWMNIDPLAETSRRFSPYTYALNNPIRFIDPDGMEADDFRINYKDKNGNMQEFIFDGGATALPDNQFVRDFVDAYNHNVGNGGGDAMEAIAKNSDIIVDVEQTSGDSHYEPAPTSNTLDVLKWNSNWGLMTDNNSFLSPATILEHESGHALGDKTGTMASTTPQKGNPYDTKEEERVIKSFEQKTAQANGEASVVKPTRLNHDGLPIITNSPTSNKPNVVKTKAYHSKQQEARNFYGIPYNQFKVKK